MVTESIEPYRREKTIRSSLEAEVEILTRDAAMAGIFDKINKEDFAELLIVSNATLEFTTEHLDGPIGVIVTRTTHHKCGRCWRHLPDVIEDGALCGRCSEMLA